jgi:hypothetical protein
LINKLYKVESSDYRALGILEDRWENSLAFWRWRGKTVKINTQSPHPFFCVWDWGLNSGLHACTAGAVLLEPHLQSILFWSFWRWGFHELFAWAGLKPRSSQFQPPKDQGMSYQWLACFLFFSFFLFF